MKRIACIILVLVLLSGCTGVKTPAAPETNDAVVTVNSVDDFLAAIAPNKTIQLESGTYDLTSAASYGQRSGNPYVKWVENYEGYELKIHDVDNLTICGSTSGATRIISDACNSNVLCLEDCLKVSLRDFTLKHFTDTDDYSSGCLRLIGCEETALSGLEMSGASSAGISLYKCRNTAVSDCLITDAASGAAEICNCTGTEINALKATKIGMNGNGWEILEVYDSEQTTIRGSSFTNGSTEYFLRASENFDFRIADCEILNNDFTSSVFWMGTGEVVIESSTVFENNLFSRWYSDFENWAIDENGEKFHYKEWGSGEPAEAVPVITEEQETVTVATADEFLAALGSNKEIVVTDTIDLSTASGYGTDGDCYSWEDPYDGFELIITGVDNLTIRGQDDLAIISAVPRYADVLTFRDCSNIYLQNLTVGHTREPGECMGGVVNLENSRQILIEECRLYGCGTLGVSSENTWNLQVINSWIYECSYGGLYLVSSGDVTIGGCEFWDLGGDTFQFTDCVRITVDGQEMPGSYWGM